MLMHEALTARYGWLPENIATMANFTSFKDLWCTLGAATSAERFTGAMQDVADRAQAGDRVLVVIAAHGGIALGDGVSFETPDQCLAKFRPGVLRIVIIEGCGAARGLKPLKHADVAYAGAGPEEESGGAFLQLLDYALLDDAGAAASADVDRDGLVSLGEAFDYASAPANFSLTGRGVVHPEQFVRPGVDDHRFYLTCDVTGIENRLLPVVRGGGFEETWPGQRLPTYWEWGYPDTGAYPEAIQVDTTQAHAGKSSIRITVLPSTDIALLQRITCRVAPGPTYRLSTWMRRGAPMGWAGLTVWGKSPQLYQYGGNGERPLNE